MTRYFLFLICVLTFGCNVPSPDSKEVHIPHPVIADDSIFNFTHDDSIQIDKINAMYKSITIPKRWLNIADSAYYVSIRKNYLDINIIYELADSSAVLKIVNVTNYPDSVSFKVSQGDTWPFKAQKKQKGVWAVTNSRTNKQTVIGEYVSGPVN